jgi:carbamate kinase
MGIVIALGGGILLCSELFERRKVKFVPVAIVPIICQHQLIIIHGKSFQIGLLVLQSIAYHKLGPKSLPFRYFEAETQISYLIKQDLSNGLFPYTLLA